MRKVILALVVVLLLVVLCSLIETIPPEGITRSNMQALRTRIFEQIHLTDEIPKQLEDVLRPEDTRSLLEDGWGEPIQYDVDPEAGVVSLRSYGRDGQEGGEGSNRDLRRRFETRHLDGKWKNDSDDMWKDSGEILN